MRTIAKFEKVSREQFIKDWMDKMGASCAEAESVYETLEMPARATKGSAGYDFKAPCDIVLKPQETITIPTGIRAKIDVDWVLMLFPRSSLGFKYRMQLNNTVGIIDSDYQNADNEGHIFAKITNDSKDGRTVEVKAGQGFIQGIFLPYGLAEEEEVLTDRTGGIGSTTK